MLNLKNDADKLLFSKMEAFVASPKGTDWCAVLKSEENGKYLIEKRNRPCFGEMRSYGTGSTRPLDKKPSDLPHPLPVGEYREAIGVPFSQYTDASYDLTPLFEYVFSKEHSPWKLGLPSQKHIHIVKNSKGITTGVILTDVEVDATTMVNLFRFLKGFVGYANHYNDNLKKHGPFVSLILAIRAVGLAENGLGLEYHFSILNSLKDMKEGKIRKLGSSVPTFAKGDDYNRPDLAFLFVPEEVNVYDRKNYYVSSVPHTHISFKSLMNVNNIPSFLKEQGIV